MSQNDANQETSIKNKIEEFLSQKKLVLDSTASSEIIERALNTSKELSLFYGETYDHTGDTIDSMKYYFFVANLSDLLREHGFSTKPEILVADTAACRNVGPEHEYKYMRLGKERANFVERVNEIYGTGLNMIKMSDYIDSEDFKRKRQVIMDVCKKDPDLMSRIEKSVPVSKLDIEREKGFMYSFDEITSIVDLDVKVGPPREDLYDNIAREISNRNGKKGLVSVFLTPSFPIGMNWSYFFSNEGIEEYGVTAYKGGSKRLQANRILVGRSEPEQVRELIKTSFISTNPRLPNPVLDIGIICEMARKRLEKDYSLIKLADDFYSGKLSPAELKEKVGRDVETYILSRF